MDLSVVCYLPSLVLRPNLGMRLISISLPFVIYLFNVIILLMQILLLSSLAELVTVGL